MTDICESVDILYPCPLTVGAWYDIHSFDLRSWRDAGGCVTENPGADWTDWFAGGVYRGPDESGIWPELGPASAPPKHDWWYGTSCATIDAYDAVCRRYGARYPKLAAHHFRVCGQPRCAEVIEPCDGSVNGMWVLAEILAETGDLPHCDRMADVMQAAVDSYHLHRTSDAAKKIGNVWYTDDAEYAVRHTASGAAVVRGDGSYAEFLSIDDAEEAAEALANGESDDSEYEWVDC